MAKAPTSTNGIDLDSDAPPGGDTVLINTDASDNIIADESDDDAGGNWDLPAGGGDKGTKTKTTTEDDAGYDDEDARLAYSDSDDFPEETQAQRLSKRAKRNARRREARGQSDAQIAALQNALLEQGRVIQGLVSGQSSLAVNTVAGQIQQMEGSLRLVDEEMAAAVKNSDGDLYAKAQGIRDQIVGKLYGLRSQKERMDSMAQEQVVDPRQTQQRQQQQQVDPRIAQTVENYFDRFCDRFPWFDPESADPDSNIVRAVDASLVAQGYQRHTPVFWQQMERTLASRYKLTPDKGEGGDDDAGGDERLTTRQERPAAAMSRGGRPPTGAARGGANGRTGFHLNETQTSMLRDEGLIGDNLSKEDIAKRDRIVNRWKAGFDSLRRQGAR